jgi:hypothetical protein
VWCGFIPNLASQSLTCLSTLAVSLPVKVLTFITSPSYLASRRAPFQVLAASTQAGIAAVDAATGRCLEFFQM